MPTAHTDPSPWNKELKTISTILSIPIRWKILYEMARVDFISVSLLARKIGMSRPATSMHLAVLRKAGLIEQTFVRLYRLPARLLPAPGADYLDLGLCRILLPPAG